MASRAGIAAGALAVGAAVVVALTVDIGKHDQRDALLAHADATAKRHGVPQHEGRVLALALARLEARGVSASSIDCADGAPLRQGATDADRLRSAYCNAAAKASIPAGKLRQIRDDLAAAVDGGAP